MAPDPGETAKAGDKRKFDTYFFDLSLVHFRIDKKVYSIDEVICGSTRWQTYLGHICNNKSTVPLATPEPNNLNFPCETCPHDWRKFHDTSPCIIRGFIYWIFQQELPNDELVKQMDHPTAWKKIAGDKSPSLTMAIELYVVGWSLEFPTLWLGMLQFIFDHVKQARSVRQTSLLSRIYSFNRYSASSPLQQFFVHIYYKWCDELSMKPEDDYPTKFFVDLLRLRTTSNKLFARKEKEDNLVIKLSDYHCHGSEKFCPTKTWGHRRYLAHPLKDCCMPQHRIHCRWVLT